MEFNDVEQYKKERGLEKTEVKNGDSSYAHLSVEDIQRVVANKLIGSMMWMFFGLLLTGVIAFYISTAGGAVAQLISKNYLIIFILEFGLVFLFSALIYKANVNVLRMIFLVYSAVNGLFFSMLAYIYTGQSIMYVFLGTLILFGTLAIYGYVTKRDLSKMGSLLTVGIIALIVVSIINIFLRSPQVYIILSMVGVAIFVLFTAYDVNRIKEQLVYHIATEGDETMIDKIQIVGALSLYLDFINLFIYLLRLFGKGRD